MRRVVFAVCVLAVVSGGGWLLGQQQAPTQLTPVPQGLMTGADTGIRVDGKTRDGKLFGMLMVRMPTGEWMEVSVGRPAGVVPLDTTRQR